MPPLARIGIVAIGRNEGKRFERCLRSLPLGEAIVVYVDSNSTDGSQALARAAGALVVDLDMTLAFTAARARNDGLAALRAADPLLELVQFIDGDCELAAGWLEQAAAFLDRHSDVAVVCGRRRERRPEASVFIRMCDDEWDTPVGEAAACGGDALMRIAAVEAVGRYDPTLTAGEEPEMCARLRRAGWRIWRLDAEMTQHDAAILRLSQWWRRNVRTGYGYVQAWRRTRRDGASIYGEQMVRAAFWALGLPLIAITALAVAPVVAAIILLAYPAQAARLAWRSRKAAGDWRIGALVLLAKFPETQGIIRYIVSGKRRDSVSAYSYKAG